MCRFTEACYGGADRSTFMENQNGLCLEHQLFIKSWEDKKRFMAKYKSEMLTKCHKNLGFKDTDFASEAYVREVDISMCLKY